MKYVRQVKTVALAGTILSLAAGTLLAQDRSGRERETRRAREPALMSVVGPQTAWSFFGSDRARLGVYPDTDQGSGVDAQGARITGVVEGGPADEAGLQEGDIIVSLDGRSVLEPLPDPLDERRLDRDESLPIQRLVATARKLEPGDDVEIVYLRDGERHTTSLTAEAVGATVRLHGIPGDLEGRLQELRERDFLPRDGEGPSTFRFFGDEGEPWGVRLGDHGLLGRCPSDHGGWSVLMEGCVAGLELVPMNRRLGQYFDADEGVLVADVTEASSLGLTPGDVILSIDGRTVEDPGDVNRILRSYDAGEKVSFSVVRQGQRRTVEGAVK